MELIKKDDSNGQGLVNRRDGFIRANLNPICSHAWMEPTENGYRGMSRTQKYDPFGNLISDETKPTGLRLEYERPRKLSLFARIKNFFRLPPEK